MSDAQPAAVGPDRIFQMINAYQASAALKAAIDLELFTALGGEARTADELADAVRASSRGVRILCDFLTITGLLHKDDARYRAAEDAATFLDKRSPAYVGTVAEFVLGPLIQGQTASLADAVRKGGTLLDGAGTVEPENPIWIEFAHNMVPLVRPSAEAIAEIATQNVQAGQPLRVLDIAAGHGIFGIEIARRHPDAHVVALDWAGVLEVAAANAAKAGVSARHELKPGDAFEVDFGEGYDVVLLTNFLHHYDAATCTALLRKVHAALKDGGRAITLEFVPNEDRVSPPEQAAFAMSMLMTTAAGDAYTFEELRKMAADAGFKNSTLHRLAAQSLVVSER